jgi:hypothetical protein
MSQASSKLAHVIVGTAASLDWKTAQLVERGAVFLQHTPDNSNDPRLRRDPKQWRFGVESSEFQVLR